MAVLNIYDGLTISRTKVTREHCGLFPSLRPLLDSVANRLGVITLWLAGLAPLYVVWDALGREPFSPLGPVSGLALIGAGLSFIYVSHNLAASREHRLALTTALVIGFGLAAGLAAFWAPYQ